MSESALIQLNAIEEALAQAETLPEITKIRDMAEAARQCARLAGYGLEMQNEAAKWKIKAEWQAGRILRKRKKNRGLLKQGTESPRGNIMLPRENATINCIPTLHDIGITKIQSSRWQLIAALSWDEIEEHIDNKMHKGQEVTSAGILRLARAYQNEEAKLSAPPLPTGKYRVIYADPPWGYGNMMPGYFSEQADHYPQMTVKEICEMPIRELADDNAVLFLWVTSPILEESFQVIEAWGFKYKASFVWDKIKHNMGHYNSVRHEFLLVCVRGSCPPDVPKLFDSVQSIERGEHSAKPEIFRQIIDTLYPNGRRIELFARGELPDKWEGYGNEFAGRESAE